MCLPFLLSIMWLKLFNLATLTLRSHFWSRMVRLGVGVAFESNLDISLLIFRTYLHHTNHQGSKSLDIP